MISIATDLTAFHLLLNGKSIQADIAPLLTLTPSPTTTTATQAGGLDPAVVAALIGLSGVVIGALIAGAFAIYQLQRNAQLQKELLRFQKELEQQTKREEREAQRHEEEAEVAQAATHQARTLAERVATYRQALRTDPRIARLQILDMNRPVEVADIYVRLRVHQETRPGYDLDPVLLEAEQQRNPNAFLKVHQQRLDQRVSTALVPEEAIRTYKRCVIVGDPGAGKSTLLKHLALLSIDQQLRDVPDLPIHIELQAFGSSGHLDLLEYAATIWEERYGFPKAEALEYMQVKLGEGNALLLDALDETLAGTTSEQAEESYRRVSEGITDLATRYPQVPMLVTARKAGYHQRPRLAGFTELEVLDFRPEDITQFVTSWFACHPDPQKRGNTTDLTTRLERNAHMQALAANPLLLSLIVIVYEEQLDLPERRAELYKQCVDTLLSKWDASRIIRRLRAFKPEHKRHLLEEVAWHFHLQGQRYFTERDLLEVIAVFLPAIGLQSEQNGQVLDEIVAENGLLKEQAHGWYGFLHMTLQEYCTAQYAVDQQFLPILLHWRDNPWWEEVLFLYAGRVHDASPLLQNLLGATPSIDLHDDLFRTDLILAGRCLANSPTIRQAPLREEIIVQLFQVVTSTSYSLTRKQAAETLAEIGGKSVNARLVALLSNEQLHRYVRGEIAMALGQLGERSVAPQLVTLLSNEQLGRYERREIAETLATVGATEEAVQALAHLVLISDIADTIHSTLWTISRLLSLRIVVTDEPAGQQVEVVELPAHPS